MRGRESGCGGGGDGGGGAIRRRVGEMKKIEAETEGGKPAK